MPNPMMAPHVVTDTASETKASTAANTAADSKTGATIDATIDAATEAAVTTAEPQRRLSQALGYAGLLPFVALAIAAHAALGVFGGAATPAAALFIDAQLAYGATILAFLGGLHWGAVLLQPAHFGVRSTAQSSAQRNGHRPQIAEALPATAGDDNARAHHAAVRRAQWALLWGVTPSLIAWLALLIPAHVPMVFALLLLAAGLVLARWVDGHLYPPAATPPWFLRLRTQLTLVATVCVLITAVAAR